VKKHLMAGFDVETAGGGEEGIMLYKV